MYSTKYYMGAANVMSIFCVLHSRMVLTSMHKTNKGGVPCFMPLIRVIKMLYNCSLTMELIKS